MALSHFGVVAVASLVQAWGAPSMVNKQQRRLAIQAAAHYFGLSKDPESFPRSVQVSVLESAPCRLSAIEPLAARVREAWRDNVGSSSRVPRLGEQDILALLSELQLKVPRDRLRDLMSGLADLDKDLVVVEVEHQGSSRMLLVNTSG